MDTGMDLSEFDKNVMDMFDLCKKILKTSDDRNVFKKKNLILSRLESYIKTYNKTDPEDHVKYFDNMFRNNRRMIMLGPQRDGWLKDGDIIITYGEDVGLKTNIKFHVSGIYFTACKIQTEIEEETEGLPGVSKPETIYPKEYLLQLYRIFHSLTESKTNKSKLTKHIETLESEIGIRKKSSTTKGDDPLAGLFNMASGMAEQLTGQKIPKDKMPGKQDFSKMLGDVINNPQTKSMLGNMMQEMQNADNIGDIVGKLMGSLGGMGGNNTENTNNAITESENTDIDVNDEFDDYE